MLVTFADSHSALSVLDVDGMKVRGSQSHCGVELDRPHSYTAIISTGRCPACVGTIVRHDSDSPSVSCVLELACPTCRS